MKPCELTPLFLLPFRVRPFDLSPLFSTRDQAMDLEAERAFAAYEEMRDEGEDEVRMPSVLLAIDD